MKLRTAVLCMGIGIMIGCASKNPVKSNIAPLLMDTRTGARTVEVDSTVWDTINVVDPEGGAVSLSLVGAPAGITLDGNVVKWVPTILDTGGRVISVIARDPQGGSIVISLAYSVKMAWARLVQRIAAEIQAEVVSFRGKSFLRPVCVVAKTREQYIAQRYASGGVGGGLSASEKVIANRVLVAEGFMRPGEDFFGETDSVLSVSVGGFYVPGSDSLWVIIGDTAQGLDTNDRITLFHEFIHAMQDQYYGLDGLVGRASSSDQAYAIRYMVEGEASYLEWFYAFKLWDGVYPYASTIRSVLPLYERDINSYLDTLHSDGTRYFVVQPFLYAYVYGPMFTGGVAGSFGEIDSKIFARPPVRCREVFNTSVYTAGDRTGFVVKIDSLMEAITATRVVYDYDEFGSLYTGILLREWGNAEWKDISWNLISDRVVVSGDSAGDSLSMCWVTHWPNVLYRNRFFDAYYSVLSQKHGQLSGKMVTAMDMVVDDSSRGCYMETKGTDVYVLDRYPVGAKSNWIDQARKRTIGNWGVVGKISLDNRKRYPWIKKERMIEQRPKKVPIKMG